MDLIRELWRGNVGLSRTFWVFGIAVNLLLTFAILYLNAQGGILTTGMGVILLLVLSSFSIIYYPFILIAIWRSANKYQGLRRLVIAAKVAVVFGWVRYLQLLGELGKKILA